MNKFNIVLRSILGLNFFVFGLNGFFHFIPMPETMPENLKTFMSGLIASQYFFPLLKGTEVLAGFLLITGYFVPLALVMLAPIVLNIFLVHLFLDQSGLIVALVIGVLEFYLAFFVQPYKEAICSLFKAKH